MAFKDQVWDMLKEVAGSLIGDFFSLGFLKKILAGAVKSKIAGEGKEGEEKTSEGDRIPEVKFGGLFNMSDEIAYMGTIALMETDADPALKTAAVSVSKYVARLKDWQQRNFRVAVGTLSHVDYLKSVKATKSLGKKEEVKVNLGVEFLRSFARLDDDEKKEVCEAAGVLDPSIGQKVRDYFKDNEEDVMKKIKEMKDKIPPKEEVYRGFFKEMFWGIGSKK